MSTSTSISSDRAATAERSGDEPPEPVATPRSRRRTLIAVGAAVIAVGAIGFAMSGNGGESAPEPGEAKTTATSTVVVEQRDLVITDSYEGTLGFGASEPVDAGRSGVVTSVAAIGTVVDPGGTLFEIDLEPTILVAGSVPAFRELNVDSDDGADITQLEQWLVDAGYGSGITVDETFDSSTAAGVEAWEEAVGRLVPDGTVERGDVVFSTYPVRISAITSDVATQVRSDTVVVEATPTAKVVTMDLEVDAAARLEPGTQVDLELPDSTSTSGTIVDIGAASSTSEDSAGPTGGQGAPAAPTVPVTIAIDDPTAAEGFDSGSVDVTLERSRVPNATAVPITALLALAEGGYALQVVDDSAVSGYRLVAVEIGSAADDFIEITAAGIDEGTEVVVPE